MSEQGVQVDPQRVIRRLANELSEAQLRASQYAALADQLVEENTELRKQVAGGED